MQIQSITQYGASPIQRLEAQKTQNQPIFGKRKHVTEQIKKSENGKFDISECIKNFTKGVLSPLTVLVKHPIMTIGTVAATGVACALVPILAPILAVGFGAASLFQLGKGVKDVIKNYKNNDYDNAEKSFNTIGEGFIGTALSILSIKPSAQVIKEAKTISGLENSTYEIAQKNVIASEIKKGSYKDATKEILSLFSKDGLHAIKNQFNPKSIKSRAQEFYKFFESLAQKDKSNRKEFRILSTSEQIEEFKKSPEGIRRANLTDGEIQEQATKIYEQVFDKLEIPKEQRPELRFETKKETSGGSYCKQTHSINYNPESYRSGVFEIENVIMHEATHCKEALLRAALPQEKVDAIIERELISRIKNGESERIIVRGNIFGPELMEPPKMNSAMKTDFIDFAKAKLYKKGNLGDISADVENLLNKHPEFVKQYTSREEALKALTDYASSHNNRYTVFTNVNIKNTTPTPLKTAEDIAKAEQSLVDNIETLEGNAANSGFNNIFGTSKKFNQYQFSAEEVLAQKNGNGYLIETMTNKIEALKKAGNLSPEQEMYLTRVINKAKAVIEYKTKGLDYYKQYTQMINNPEDKNLAKIVNELEKELEILETKINREDFEQVQKIIAPILSMFIPASTTEMVNIVKANN